ncbi:MAG TPA: DinB family protein [Ignavibacteria bacterium]|nr:DinB family protein [Ignavibacteria bacterium]
MRPTENEYASFYKPYIDEVPDGDIIVILTEQGKEARKFYQSIPEAIGAHAYQPGKWTIKEVLGHMCDAERVMAYRAMSIARNEKTPLPGFDENEYMNHSNFNRRTIQDISDEMLYIRASNIALFGTFDEEILNRTGNANGNNVSVRGLLYIISGHELHHIKVLRERYLR